MRARSPWQHVRGLLLAVALGLLAWLLVAAVVTAGRTTTGMMRVGWDQYLGRTHASPLVFFVACQTSDICRTAWQHAWQASLPVFLVPAFLLACAGAAVVSGMAGRPGSRKPPGGARWASRRDLRHLLRGERGSPQRGYVGVHASGRMLRVPERLRCSHTLIVGGTGAGKSTGYYKPNLLVDALDHCSAIVFDLKYPDADSGFLDMIPHFERAGHVVQKFVPYDPDSLRLPLLLGAEDANEAARVTDVLSPLREGARDGGFFSRQQRALLTGLLMGSARTNAHSLGGITRLLLGGTGEVAQYVRQHPDAGVRERLVGLFDLREDIRNGIIRGLIEELELFTDARLDRATSPSPDPENNIDLTAVGMRPTLLYVGIPQDELMRARGHVLLQLVKRTLDLALIRTANQHGGRLPVHTSYYLDEFGSLGRLPDVGSNFATMRSRRVAYHVSLQNRAQGEAIYGTTAFTSFLTSNFRQILIFPRYLAYDDAAYFSRALGELTAVEEARGTSRRHLLDGVQRNETRRLVGRALLSIEEMTDWPEGEAVLLQGGTPPARVLLPRLDQARVRGHRNPLHAHDWPQAAPSRPASPLPRSIRQPTAPSRKEPPQALRAAPEPPPETRPEAGPRVRDATAAPTSEELLPLRPHRALVAWFDTLLARDIPMTPTPKSHKHHELASVTIPKASLTPALRSPPQLGNWIERAWVEQDAASFRILAEGLPYLGEGRLKRCRVTADRRARTRKAERVRVRAPEGAPRRAEDQARERLRRWVAEHSQQLQGHPDFEALAAHQKHATVLLGRYQPRSYRLPSDTVRQLVSGIPAEWRKVRINNRQGVVVPAAALNHHPRLAQWCRQNAHLLAGHPQHKGSPEETLGVYVEESLALPRRAFTRILGEVPEDARDRELALGVGKQRQRTRLAEITLPHTEEDE